MSLRAETILRITKDENLSTVEIAIHKKVNLAVRGRMRNDNGTASSCVTG